MRGTGPSVERSARGRALLLLDLTVDRLQPGGAWPVKTAPAVRRFIQGELSYFRERGRPVLHVVTRAQAAPGVPPHNQAGSPGGELDDAFAPRPGELLIDKHVDSAFCGTTLAAQLAELDVGQLTLVGLETHAGILATALEGVARGFLVVVPDTCVASSDAALHEAALTLIRAGCWLRAAAPVASEARSE